MNNFDEVVKEFKKTRTEQGLSSKAITENDGGSAYRFEAGTSVPRLDTFIKWCEKMGLKVKLVKK